MLAAEWGHVEVVRLLLASGCNENAVCEVKFSVANIFLVWLCCCIFFNVFVVILILAVVVSADGNDCIDVCCGRGSCQGGCCFASSEL